MFNKIFKSFITFFFFIFCITLESFGNDNIYIKDSVLIDGLNGVITIEFSPDGRLFMLEKSGKVLTLEKEEIKSWYKFKDVEKRGEKGLLGIAFDPDYKDNKYIYFYYTKGRHSLRVVRLKEENGFGKDETLLFEVIDNVWGTNHNGGDLEFGDDGKLYLTIGDGGGTPGTRSQRKDMPLGKIIKLDIRKKLPLNFDEPMVYARGLRNSFRMAFYRGKLFATENGPSDHDEINLIVENGNYGWPDEKGMKKENKFINPLYDFGAISVSPTGIVFLEGNIYVADYNFGRLYRGTMSKEGDKILNFKKIWEKKGKGYNPGFADLALYKGKIYGAMFNKIVVFEIIDMID